MYRSIFIFILFCLNLLCYAQSDDFNQGEVNQPLIGSESPSGRSVAIWRNSGTGVVQAATFNGSVWSAPVNISATGIELGKLDLSVGSFNNTVAVWHNVSFGRIEAAKFNGISWLPVVIISSPNTLNSEPAVDVARSSTGAAFVIWINTTNRVIQAAQFINGTTRSNPLNVSAVGQVLQTPDITVTSATNASAVWTNIAFGRIESARFDGVSWTSPAINISRTGN